MQRKNKGKSSGKNTKVHMLDMDLKAILREHALRYLPAKTLFRSLSVCRDWKLQISTPFFVHNQSVSFRSFSGIFLQSRGGTPFFVSLDQMAYGVPNQELSFLPEPVDIKASTNGLLCCVGRGINRPYYVCNPVNQQWKKLPKPDTDHGSDPSIALVFDPSPLNFIAEFKVVCVFTSTDIEGAYEFEIYSSNSDSWKISSEMYFVNRESKTGFQFGRGMYLDGVVYWSGAYGKTLSFNIKTQKASEVPVSYIYSGSSYGYNGSPSSLGTMDGKLCTSSVSGHSIQVTVIQSRHTNTMAASSTAINNVSKKFASSLNGVEYGGNYQTRVLVTWDGVVVLQAGNKIVSHDMKMHQTRVLVQGDRRIDAHDVVLPYVNSLVSLE